MIHPPKILKTERLRLRKAKISDAEAIFRQYAQDPEVTRYVSWRAHKDLDETRQYMRMLGDDDGQNERLVKTSLGNLVRICEPAVILDEGHKATSALARQTIEGFNASL